MPAATLAAHMRPLRTSIWRMVEAQHVASTMKLVDSAAEQDLLEILIEAGKPPQPHVTSGFDYLLASPFRYPPLADGSRFRATTDPGVFYGAEQVRTACAELGYWRWRFLLDSPALMQLGPVAHTAFRTKVATDRSIDLRMPPFDADTSTWMARQDYGGTQAFAAQAREEGVQAIVYASVRDPQHAWCAALLTPLAFAQRKPDTAMQSWWLRVSHDEVSWRRDDRTTLRFDTAAWQ